MKRVIVAMQNTLVSEVVTQSLKKCDVLVEKALNDTPDGIINICQVFFGDVLFMDVTRFGNGSFESRMKTMAMVKKNSPRIKVCLICDNASDVELSFKIANAKKLGLIDNFFYQSVPSDYIADVISTM